MLIQGVQHPPLPPDRLTLLLLAPDKEDISQTEEHDMNSDFIPKIGASCFFYIQECRFRMECTLFWEAVKNQGHPKHNLAQAAVQNTRNRQAEIDLHSKEAANGELLTKVVKAVSQVEDALGAETRSALVINYEKAAAEAIKRVKHDMATKEIEQRLKHEIERQKMNETLSTTRKEPETGENLLNRSNCNP